MPSFYTPSLLRISMLLVAATCACNESFDEDFNSDRADLGSDQWNIETSVFPGGDPSNTPTAESVTAYLTALVSNLDRYADHYNRQLKVVPDYNESTDLSVRVRIVKDGSNIWQVSPHGNPAKSENLSDDVMTFIACHELGHFFGGFPFHYLDARGVRDLADRGTVIAAELPADYFATKDCLPRFWAHERAANATFRDAAVPYVRNACDAQYGSTNQQNLCYRIAAASIGVSIYIEPSTSARVDTPSKEIVDETAKRSTTQVRLDTMMAGALCPVKNDLRVIPGLVKSPNGLYGEHSVASEMHAKQYACLDGPGARPLSWFKPNMPDIVYFDCGDFPESGKCINGNVQNCHNIRGIEEEVCTTGCTIDDDLAICNENL